jgi:hypothetical protein
MKIMTKFLLTSFAVSMILCAPMLMGESKSSADYPLRIRIYSKDAVNAYFYTTVQEQKGEGRGNLFEGDDVHGVDFNYSCSEKLPNSFGYETYPAKWKKQGKVVMVLVPVMGKANTFNTCDLNVALRDNVYKRNNGKMGEEPAAKYKAWMVKHDYDPVHDKNTPRNLSAAEKAEEAETPAAAPASAPNTTPAQATPAVPATAH